MADQPTPLDRLGVARALREMAALLAAASEEPFRARAYERGARAMERLELDLPSLVQQRALTRLPDIGPGLAAVITELHLTGRSETLDRLRQRLPPGALELSQIPGLSLQRIAAIHETLGVRTVADLEEAARAGRLRTVPGIGPKTERSILDKIRALAAPPPPVRIRMDDALEQADSLAGMLRGIPGVEAVDVAGAVRRWVETVDRLSIVVLSAEPGAVAHRALTAPPIARVEAQNADGASGWLGTGLPFDLAFARPDHRAAALLHATGSADHLRDLARAARDTALELTPRGLVEAGTGTRVAAASERDIYARLGLPYIAPELREGQGEVAAALAGDPLDDLVSVGDVRGLVHCHTVHSDGRHTIEQMARAADALGMPYMTITDHSPAASYAGGLSVDRLLRQWDEIAAVQASVGVRLFRGAEVDILADGALDYPDDVLERLDVIIASIHARHRMDEDQMTRRLVRAMRHPCFKIWGHALGRLVLSRPPIPCRIEEVLDTIAASAAAIEINGDPRRLDLEPRWVRAARDRGISFVLSTDAHSIGELGNVPYAVAMARRGWVRRREVLNALGAEAFARAVSPARRT